ncbi:hypothetical protein H180DRAFT_05255 [Streptomyces sp. WMMB 322]|nr:hypothetical protein H180DRAFT_05255 [Streptomyces sp. WMMB 322]
MRRRACPAAPRRAGPARSSPRCCTRNRSPGGISCGTSRRVATYFSMQSSPTPVSVKMSPSKPEVWVSSCLTVICSEASRSAMRNSGRYLRTGSSGSTRPSSTSCMTSVLVHSFVTDPIWKTESVVASTPVALLSTPAAPSTSSSPLRTPQAAAGTSYMSSSAGSRSSIHAVTSRSSLVPGHVRKPVHGCVRRHGQCVRGWFVGGDKARRAIGVRRCLTSTTDGQRELRGLGAVGHRDRAGPRG